MIIPININQKSSEYNVYINEDKKITLNGKVAIVTNETIAPLWLDKFIKTIECKELHTIILKDGEEYKNLTTLEYILEQMFLSKLDRKSTLISLGGGVISDMTGFAASIYERGIDFINVATTLLAQIDASVGGKTGINNKFGKNLIGSFYQPKAVYCNIKYLQTLNAKEFNAGMAEAIKIAVMFDKDLFDYIANNDFKDEKEVSYLVARCVEIKANVVKMDEKEQGIRAVLNYGHTFAHVIENQTEYKKYLHGEAVSIGMVMANELSYRLGYISLDEKENIKKVLEKFSLPTSYKIKDEEEFYNLFFLDKKSSNNKIKFILPKSIGEFVILDDILKDEVLKTLKEFK